MRLLTFLFLHLETERIGICWQMESLLVWMTFPIAADLFAVSIKSHSVNEAFTLNLQGRDAILRMTSENVT